MASLLLDGIPPEIRLVIYEILFTAVGPVTFEVDDSDRYPHQKKVVYSASNRFIPEHNQLGGAINLLRACRTIHREALPILYGTIDYRFSLDLIPDFPREISVAAWIEQIGPKNAANLRHITILVPSTTYDLRYRNSREHLEMGALLGLCWSEPKLRLEFYQKDTSFKCTHRLFRSGVSAYNKDGLASLLRELRLQDLLKRQWNMGLLKHIWVSCQGKRGCLGYPSTEAHNVLKINFDFDQGNTSVGKILLLPVLSATAGEQLFNLPKHVLDQILTYVLGPSQEVRLDAIPFHQGPPAGLLVCKELARPTLRLYQSRNTFSFHCTITSNHCDQINLWLLYAWLHKRSLPDVGNFRIVLHFDLKPPVPLEQIRFKSADLAELCQVWLNLSFDVVLTLSSGQRHSVSLDYMLMDAVRLLEPEGIDMEESWALLRKGAVVFDGYGRATGYVPGQKY